MRKPVLGRGLGRLMQPDAPRPKDEAPPLAPGLKILIRGADGIEEDVPAETQSSAAPTTAPGCEPVPARAEPSSLANAKQTDTAVLFRKAGGCVLLLADAALVGWAVVWMTQHSPITPFGMAMCVGSLVLGCLAGAVGVLLLSTE